MFSTAMLGKAVEMGLIKQMLPRMHCYMAVLRWSRRRSVLWRWRAEWK
jgi:hypothetical protein